MQLGGVVIPNDGLCRMNVPSTPGEEVDYNDWNVYDYPSIGRIHELLRKKDIFIIFAVVHEFRELYDVSLGCCHNNNAYLLQVSFIITC